MNQIIYCIRFFIISIACGCLFASFKQILTSIKIENRFLAGCCSATLIIPFLDYLLALVWPGVPEQIIQYFPLILSVCFLFWHHNYRLISDIVRSFVLSSIKSFSDNIKKALKGENAQERYHGLFYVLGKTIMIIMILILMIPVVKLTEKYNELSLSGMDQSHYMMQARFFAEDRNSYEIDNYQGEKEGTVLTDDHGPLWPVYLGDALIFAGTRAKNSPIFHYAYIITAYLMLLMLANVAGAIMGWHASWLSIIVVLCYRYMMDFPLNGSRDGFRFIALLLFLLEIFDLMIRLDDYRKDRKIRINLPYSWKDYLFLLFSSYLCQNGHGGNAYIMFGLICIITISSLTVTKKASTSIWLFISASSGVALCLIKNVIIYINTGKFRSYTTDVYTDTLVQQIIIQQKENNKVQQSLLASYTPEEKSILLFSLIVFSLAMVYCFSVVFLRKTSKILKDEKLCRLCIMCLLFIGMNVPMTGMLNFITGDVQKWFFEQLRYRMFLYLSCGLLVGVVCAYFIQKQIVQRCLFYTISLVPFFIAVHTEKTYYPTLYKISNKQVAFFEKTAKEIDLLISDGYTFCNDQIFSWYLEKPAKYTCCNYVKPLYKAETKEEIETAINELNLQVFVFDWRGEMRCKQLPFYEYLCENYTYTEKEYDKGLIFEIYSNKLSD